MQVNKYTGLTNRVLVDIDNERRYDRDILGLSQTDDIIDFQGNIVKLIEGSYIYTFTENFDGDIPGYILAEGFVIPSPYKDLPYKWCCKLEGEIEYSEDYNKRFNMD